MLHQGPCPVFLMKEWYNVYCNMSNLLIVFFFLYAKCLLGSIIEQARPLNWPGLNCAPLSFLHKHLLCFTLIISVDIYSIESPSVCVCVCLVIKNCPSPLSFWSTIIHKILYHEVAIHFSHRGQPTKLVCRHHQQRERKKMLKWFIQPQEHSDCTPVRLHKMVNLRAITINQYPFIPILYMQYIQFLQISYFIFYKNKVSVSTSVAWC